MVELVEDSLLINNTTYSESVVIYTYEEALNYCDNISSGGYTDFRMPTKNELTAILKTAILSETERGYLENYFNDYTKSHIGNGTYKYERAYIWSSEYEENSTHYIAYTKYLDNNYDTWSIRTASKTSFMEHKAFCVRNW